MPTMKTKKKQVDLQNAFWVLSRKMAKGFLKKAVKMERLEFDGKNQEDLETVLSPTPSYCV